MFNLPAAVVVYYRKMAKDLGAEILINRNLYTSVSDISDWFRVSCGICKAFDEIGLGTTDTYQLLDKLDPFILGFIKQHTHTPVTKDVDITGRKFKNLTSA